MNRFKASKLRHTEARLPRREVSAGGGLPGAPPGAAGPGWGGRHRPGVPPPPPKENTPGVPL